MEEFDTAANSQVQEPFAGLDGAEAETRKRWSGLRLLREIAETVLLTLLIFVVINTLTGRFRIEGPSMTPTLHENQYLIINKIVYRLHPPRRGDIVVFHHPRDLDRDLIKRVVGLPGEKIEIRQGQVYIDGIPLKEPYVLRSGSRFIEYQLGADDYFVLGDNRPNSDDSRNWGPLKGDQIVGKAWISYWPPTYWGAVSHYDHLQDLAVQKSETSGKGGRESQGTDLEDVKQWIKIRTKPENFVLSVTSVLCAPIGRLMPVGTRASLSSGRACWPGVATFATRRFTTMQRWPAWPCC